MTTGASKEARELAKREGLYLAAIVVDGRPAKKGSVSFSGPIGQKTAEKLIRLIGELANKEERLK